MRKLVCCVVGGLMLATLFPGTATAADQGTLPVRVRETVAKTFPRIPSAVTQRVVTPGNSVNANTCKTANYCDTVRIDALIPPSYRKSYVVRMTVSWDESGGSNNLAVYGWKTEDADDGTSKSQRTETMNPKVIELQQPEGEQIFTIVNWQGTNTGYKIELSWIESDEDFVDLSVYQRPKIDSGPTVSTGTTNRPSFGSRTDYMPEMDMDMMDRGRPKGERTVLVPGPDGELIAMEVPVLARGNRTPPIQRRFDPFVASMVGFLLLSGAVVGGFAIRAKRRAEALG